MDFLFKLAILLLPFDNLFFAPSAGWATVTPIIMFVYMIFNHKYLLKIIKKYEPLFIVLVLSIFLSIINFIFVGYNISSVVDTIFTLFLGIIILMSLEIYFVHKKNPIDKIVKLLLFSYTLSFLIGWIQFLTLKYGIQSLYNLIDFLSKRNYMPVGRIQFSFTEPSFIGMHVFGVILPVYYISKNKKALLLIVLFSISNLIFNSSVRFLIDEMFVLFVILFSYFWRNKKRFMIVFVILVSLFSLNLAYQNNARIRYIVDKGIYADGSLATRYFRIQSSIYGYKNDIIHMVIGYGFGNSILPIRSGYSEALSEYKSDYLAEIIGIGSSQYYNSNASFCLYTRVISEFGLLNLILISIYIMRMLKKSSFKYKYEFLIIFLYLYLQFDSYAFYTFWLFLFVLKNFSKIINERLDINENSTN